MCYTASLPDALEESLTVAEKKGTYLFRPFEYFRLTYCVRCAGRVEDVSFRPLARSTPGPFLCVTVVRVGGVVCDAPRTVEHCAARSKKGEHLPVENARRRSADLTALPCLQAMFTAQVRQTAAWPARRLPFWQTAAYRTISRDGDRVSRTAGTLAFRARS